MCGACFCCLSSCGRHFTFYSLRFCWGLSIASLLQPHLATIPGNRRSKRHDTTIFVERLPDRSCSSVVSAPNPPTSTPAVPNPEAPPKKKQKVRPDPDQFGCPSSSKFTYILSTETPRIIYCWLCRRRWWFCHRPWSSHQSIFNLGNCSSSILLLLNLQILLVNRIRNRLYSTPCDQHRQPTLARHRWQWTYRLQARHSISPCMEDDWPTHASHCRLMQSSLAIFAKHQTWFVDSRRQWGRWLDLFHKEKSHAASIILHCAFILLFDSFLLVLFPICWLLVCYLYVALLPSISFGSLPISSSSRSSQSYPWWLLWHAFGSGHYPYTIGRLRRVIWSPLISVKYCMLQKNFAIQTLYGWRVAIFFLYWLERKKQLCLRSPGLSLCPSSFVWRRENLIQY